MPHQRVILKLKVHCIGDGIIYRIQQGLTDRKQRIVVDGEISYWKSVNDLDDNITCNVLKFADDTKCLERLKLMVKNNIYKTI